MKVLLLAGFGPYTLNQDVIKDSLFDIKASMSEDVTQVSSLKRPVDLNSLVYSNGNTRYKILRPREQEYMPHLTSSTLCNILERADIDHEYLNLENVWNKSKEPIGSSFDAVLLSTTFICDYKSLFKAIVWITKRYHGVPLILGGHFSNLKYREIFKSIPDVSYIIRGDGEIALPKLLRAINGVGELSSVPNLVAKSDDGRNIVSTEIEYIDLDKYPTVSYHGKHTVIPYESMRGCPFSCKFCSFPSSSPKWRYKSVIKIANDFLRYKNINGAEIIKTMDSTFTIPKDRFNSLLEILPEVGVNWGAFARANAIDNKETVEKLERSHCKDLSIGFESMSNDSLRYMNKRVTAEQNYNAYNLLTDSTIDYRVSFMIGYPGETLDNYEETHKFIVDEYSGRFMLSVFTFTDETMPVYQDAELYGLEVTNPGTWKHNGMDSDTARKLYSKTVREARWKSEEGVYLSWQSKYMLPLVPDLSIKQNLRVEKQVERLAYVMNDFSDNGEIKERYENIMGELNNLGVSYDAGK